MNPDLELATHLLKAWKGPSYTFGRGVLNAVGAAARPFGRKAALVVADFGLDWVEPSRNKVVESLAAAGVESESVLGARPNAPREDLYRIALHAARIKADVLVALGGGSTIDSAKAAAVLLA